MGLPGAPVRRKRIHEDDLVFSAERDTAERARRRLMSNKLEQFRRDNFGFLRMEENRILIDMVYQFSGDGA